MIRFWDNPWPSISTQPPRQLDSASNMVVTRSDHFGDVPSETKHCRFDFRCLVFKSINIYVRPKQFDTLQRDGFRNREDTDCYGSSPMHGITDDIVGSLNLHEFDPGWVSKIFLFLFRIISRINHLYTLISRWMLNSHWMSQSAAIVSVKLLGPGRDYYRMVCVVGS